MFPLQKKKSAALSLKVACFSYCMLTLYQSILLGFGNTVINNAHALSSGILQFRETGQVNRSLVSNKVSRSFPVLFTKVSQVTRIVSGTLKMLKK